MDMVRFVFPCYYVFLLEKRKRVASGILVGVKNTITSSFKIIKHLDESIDKIEIALLNYWMNNHYFKIFSTYNPPNNNPSLDLISVNGWTIVIIVISDFNAYSQNWGYRDGNLAGDAVAEFLCSKIIWSLF
ncbi:hypothetical protein NPIL_452541 [Nephila pilipes]|uniref:Endonuclease/exonuclease/phosphatase domain-containing protein n=1 Tax=Nephila pilipes TaxID=299642 RepID=A0A8X6PEN1_NEPPI|nr:hypothetical protein NPIL_452541 [Nephila pilipes]